MSQVSELESGSLVESGEYFIVLLSKGKLSVDRIHAPKES